MSNIKKITIFTITLVLALSTLVRPVLAHVVVSPKEVRAAAFQTFTMGVPNEKENSTISLRLVIPEGLMHVAPNVKPGWTIDVIKSGEGEEARVVEISWRGGTIPVGMRDDFLFSAQTPGVETNLLWKAYQTYSDGTVVSWDQPSMSELSHEDKEKMEQEGKGPYSQTKVTDDLAPSNDLTTNSLAVDQDKGQGAKLIAGIAIILSLVAIGMPFVMKKK